MASVRAARPIVSRHSESSFTVRLHANPTQPTLALWGVERDAPAKGEAGGTDRVSLSLFAESLDSFFVLAKGGLFENDIEPTRHGTRRAGALFLIN